jgi:hypothetical protein
MKKISFFAVVFLTGFFVINSLPQFTVFSAKNENQNGAPKSDDNSVTQDKIVKDRELAATIRELTNRSTAGLIERRAAAGGFTIDLEDRFQNVMLQESKQTASRPPRA